LNYVFEKKSAKYIEKLVWKKGLKLFIILCGQKIGKEG
jgi:hypothetical protein